MTPTKNWQDPVNAALGAWLLLSPFMLKFMFDVAPAASAVVSGLLLIAVAFGMMLTPRAWEEWAEAAIGMWLIAAPWVLGFSDMLPAMRGSVVTGAVVLALALSVIASDRNYSAWMHRRSTH